jgi:hypothetical protein
MESSDRQYIALATESFPITSRWPLNLLPPPDIDALFSFRWQQLPVSLVTASFVAAAPLLQPTPN